MTRTLALLVAMVVLGPVLYAQGPDADWKTVETAHFRVHYPVEYEAWALRAASRLESIREVVSKEVGFTPPQKIDLLIVNPIAQANGSAWPLLDTPRMIFYAEPPGPDEQLGAYGHWIDLLAVHETAHLVHLLRPSRNPWGRLTEKFVAPLNPITLRGPRWVIEGYATVIEGRLTGAGRPSSTVRALILRSLAQSGRLPAYGQLNSDRRFLGMSMAYLMGSAYLEWLEQRAGEDALRNLWARMTARQRRSFDEAFTGVFGERPDRLYGRFLAEVTASAIAIDRSQEKREGELFQETPRASGDLAISPDGKQLAVVIRDREKPEKLVVWSTEPADEEEKKFAERIAKILQRDPQDVAPIRTKPLPRKVVHSLTMADGGDIVTPRWTRDGKAIVFAHRVTDADGMLHFDLYRWDFDDVARITHLADVRDADPLPDGRTAVAVRSRYGATQLVNVDLQTGAVTPRTEPSIDLVVTHPRVSPDGARVAYVAHRGGRWTLFVEERALELPGDASSPEWMDDGTLVATISQGGFAELHRIDVGRASARQDDGGLKPALHALTSTAGGAFDPAPAADGRVFFTSLEPDGFVVRVLPSNAPAPAMRPPFDAALVPAVPPQPPQGVAFAAQDLPPARGYGIGRQEWSWLSGQTYAPEHRAFELGIRLGDVVGRFDTLLIASLARDDAPQGVALASAWRGWPVELHGHAYHAEDDSGGELRATWTRLWPQHRLTLEAGANDAFPFAGASFSTRQMRGTTRFEQAIRVEVDEEHQRAVLGASVRSGSMRLAARYQHDEGEALALGGVASSILPRSAYARRILDPALPLATLSGADYDGWRIETNLPSMPFTAFYQRHELAGRALSLAGVEILFRSDPMPILKVPGLDVTLGAARVFDAPLEGDTQWWLAMRWRP